MVVDLRHPRRVALIDLVPNRHSIDELETSASLVDASFSAFDYNSLPVHVQIIAKEAANKIRFVRRKQLEGILEIGNVLNSIKKTLAHGTYQDWVREELQLEPRTAQNYAMAAEAFYGKSETISHLKMTKIYALSRAAVPQIVPKKSDHLSKTQSSSPVEKPDSFNVLVSFLVAAVGFDLTNLLLLLQASGYEDLALAVDAEDKRRNRRPTKDKKSDMGVTKTGSTRSNGKRSPPKI